MQKAPKKAHIKQVAPKEAQVPEKYEISISYVHTREKWDRSNIVINNIFTFQVAYDIIKNDEDLKPRNIKECRYKNY